MTDEMPSRKVGPTYQLDANRINAHQKDAYVNQLESWHDAGVIFLEMPSHAYEEAGRCNVERTEKASKYTWISTNDTIGGESEFRRKIETIVFPRGANSKGEKNDIWILFTARQANATLITADGASKTQPGGMLGNAPALAELGIRVVSARAAVEEIKCSIQQRDQLARRVSASTGISLPHWVGQDDLANAEL